MNAALCELAGCFRLAVGHGHRRHRCALHQGCNECGHEASHYSDCPKIDAGRMEDR